jgi:hypothetical protein
LSGPVFVSVFNPVGIQVLRKVIDCESQAELDLSTCASGIYLVRIEQAGHQDTQKLVLRKE